MTRTEIEEKVEKIVTNIIGITTIKSENDFDKIGIDSIDVMTIVMDIECELDIEIDDEKAEQWKNLENIVDYLEGAV